MTVSNTPLSAKSTLLKLNTPLFIQQAICGLRFKVTVTLIAIVNILFGTVFINSALAATSNLVNSAHISHNADIMQPIAALDTLSSLQNVEPLDFHLPALQRFTTSSGVPVLFFQTNQLPIVDIDIRFNAGSARDAEIRPDSYGLANMTATLLTKGTKDLDEEQFIKTGEKLSMTLRSMAFKDQFVVSLRSLSDSATLLPALQLAKDVMSKPRFDVDVLQRTKTQHILHLKQLEQSPAYIADVAFNNALYGEHPYAHSSYGTIDSVSTITVNDLEQFKDKFLVANNAALNMTGDLTLQQAKQAAEILTNGLNKGTAASTLPTPQPITTAKRIHIDYNSDQMTVIIGQLGYAIDSDSNSINTQTQFSIANEALAGLGFGSLLMRKVRTEFGYTYGIYGSMNARQTNGAYSIRFSTRNEKTQNAIDLTLDTVNSFIDRGLSPATLMLTKEGLINRYPMGFSSNASINSMLGSLSFNRLPDSYLTDYVNRVKAADLTSINATLKETLDPTSFIIVTVGDASSYE